MNCSVEAFDELGRRIVLTIPWAEFEGRYRNELDKEARKARLKGFRPGKVPLSVVERRVGDDVRETLAHRLLLDQINDHEASQGWRLVDEPVVESISLAKRRDVVVRAEFEVEPQLDFDQLPKIELDMPRRSLGEADVEWYYLNVLRSLSDPEPVEPPPVKGDLVHLWIRKRSGSAVSAGGYDEPGNFEHPPGDWESFSFEFGADRGEPGLREFEEKVSTCSIGETRTVEMPPNQVLSDDEEPEDGFHYEFRLLGVRRRSVPESLGRSHFQDLGFPDVTTEEELKSAIREDQEWAVQEDLAVACRSELFRKIRMLMRISVPNRYIARRAEQAERGWERLIRGGGRLDTAGSEALGPTRDERALAAMSPARRRKWLLGVQRRSWFENLVLRQFSHKFELAPDWQRARRQFRRIVQARIAEGEDMDEKRLERDGRRFAERHRVLFLLVMLLKQTNIRWVNCPPRGLHATRAVVRGCER